MTGTQQEHYTLAHKVYRRKHFVALVRCVFVCMYVYRLQRRRRKHGKHATASCAETERTQKRGHTRSDARMFVMYNWWLNVCIIGWNRKCCKYHTSWSHADARARVQQQCARRIRMEGVWVGFFFERVTLFPHREREQRAHDYAAFTAASTVQKLEWHLSAMVSCFFSKNMRARVAELYYRANDPFRLENT